MFLRHSLEPHLLQRVLLLHLPHGALRYNYTTPAAVTHRLENMVVQTRQSVAAEDRLELLLGNLSKALRSTADPPPAAVSAKHAAVLVPLFADPASGEVHVVLTQRSSRLKTHSGEVCLPGGKRDPGDADDTATALREAQEELGIQPAAVQVVGCLPPFLSKHLLSVTPVIGVLPPQLQFQPNPAEVEHVFTAPLRRFLEAGTGYHSRDVEWEPGIPYRLHFFDHLYKGRSFNIWGLTAGVLIVVAEAAFGRAPAFQPNPPGAAPYTHLRYDGGRLRYGAAPLGGGDALQLASAAAAEESPPSAAVYGAVVTSEEAEAAIHDEG